jgi:hypothetical protein
MFVSLQFKLELKKEDREKLTKLMHKQSSGSSMLKYALQLNIDKDTASAYVIGRRALGFREDTPENYEKPLKNRTYLEFALKGYEEREKELRELIEKETNQYKRNALESGLRIVENSKKLLTNLIQSLFPILGKVLPRYLFPLKPVLVEEAWDRVRSRLVPLSARGTVLMKDF